MSPARLTSLNRIHIETGAIGFIRTLSGDQRDADSASLLRRQRLCRERKSEPSKTGFPMCRRIHTRFTGPAALGPLTIRVRKKRRSMSEPPERRVPGSLDRPYKAVDCKLPLADHPRDLLFDCPLTLTLKARQRRVDESNNLGHVRI